MTAAASPDLHPIVDLAYDLLVEVDGQPEGLTLSPEGFARLNQALAAVPDAELPKAVDDLVGVSVFLAEEEKCPTASQLLVLAALQVVDRLEVVVKAEVGVTTDDAQRRSKARFSAFRGEVAAATAPKVAPRDPKALRVAGLHMPKTFR